MPTNKQRREAERRRLQRQLEERRRRQAARKQFTLIASIVGTLVVIAAVVIVLIVVIGGNDNNKKQAQTSPSPTPSTTAASPSPTTTPSSSPVPVPTQPCRAPDNKATTTFKGVTVGHATNLKQAPKVTSKSSSPAPALECADLVIGKGAKARPTSTVSVQYTGVLYSNGKQFDSSWARGGTPVQFPLAQVVPGFKQAIGGAGKVTPMRVGSRRLIIMPASLAYGASAQNGIPANSSLAFVVDLTKIG
ncbi:MAG TPA: FKBP-type peptidyl-prolyl cis-trans isomerase [Jatrophihabitans sp.]|nr:FKBP-type peptidyl-prolyl cis-trans isomerase [Jatrophihabitans sp.]